MSTPDLTSAPVSPAIPHIGLFDRLFRNPILLRELRVGGRSIRILVAHIVCLLIQGFVFSLIVILNSVGVFSPQDIGENTFIAQSIIMVVMICTIFPAFSCTAIVSEKDRNCLDLLSMTHFEPWELVWGKFLSALLHSALFMITALPLYVLSVTYGGFPMTAVLVSIGLLVPISVLFAAWGIYMSSMVKRPMAAMVSTYIVSFSLGFVLLLATLALTYSWIGRGSDWLGFIWESTTWQRGVLYIAVLTSILLNSAFMICASVVRLKSETEDRATPLRVMATVGALISIIVVIVASSAFSDIPTDSFPAFAVAALTFAGMISVLPAIKSIGESGFAPRGVTKSQAKLKPPMRQIRWLLGPGSTPAFVLSGILVCLVLCTVATISSREIISRGSAIEETARTTMQDVDVSKLTYALRSIRISSDVSASVGGAVSEHEARRAELLREPLVSQEALLAHNLTMIDAYSTIAWMPWRLVGVGLLVLLAFGSISWWLSFAPRNSKAASIWGGASLAIVTLIPLWANFVLSQRFGIDVSPISPATLIATVTEGTVIDAAWKLNPGSNMSLALAAAEAENSRAFWIGVLTLSAISVLGLGLGTMKRAKALRLREANAGRWPIPLVPPPREFVASRQTALTTGQGEVPPPPSSNVPWG